MKELLYRILSLGPNVFSFLSGVLISVAVNLYTAILPPIDPGQVVVPLMSGLFFLAAGCCSVLLTWELEEIDRVVLSKRPALFVNTEQTLDFWRVVIDSRLTKLAFYAIFSLVCSMLAAAVLAIPLLLLVLDAVSTTGSATAR